MAAGVAHPLAAELDLVLEHSLDAWTELRGARIYITGGTGFVGRWLLESFAWANARLSLGATTTVLTRDPDAFAARAPHLAADQSITMLRGDVRESVYLPGSVSHVIHGATAASAALNTTRPIEMFDTIVDGTRRTMETAARAHASRLLFISSGAVYGAQPPAMTHVNEAYLGGPDVLASANAYAEGKRAGEMLALLHGRAAGIAVPIARLFAFVGPHLPLDQHFAIGNFIGDALRGSEITLNGDGTPYRSYLYAADLAAWLWVMLVRGVDGHAYNVGSERDLPLWDVARIVSDTLRAEGAGAAVRAREPVAGMPAARYVPATRRAREELGLDEWTSLEDGIRRTHYWHVRQPGRVR
jgi:nucleoside-diphosphate-sugar epimerase